MAVMRNTDWSTAGPLLKGGPVYLRYPQASDYAAWAEVREESRDFLVRWEPTWPADDLTRMAFRRRLKRYANDIKEDIAYPFFVFRAEDDGFVGGVTVSNIRRGVAQACSLGYWAGKRYARQGYTSAAVKALFPFVFKTLKLHRLEAACIPTNEPSKNLLLGAGFSQEGYARKYLKINGEWQDHLLFALVEDDPWR
jgi:ribosomal-protein-alanine N-acetyltransferase